MNITPQQEEAWNKAKKLLEDDLNPASYDTWIRPLKVEQISSDTITIEVPTTFQLSNIRQRYFTMLYNVVAMSFGRRYELELLTSLEIEHQRDRIQHTNLNPKYTFSNFVVGAGNQLAYAASLAVAEEPSSVYNPLFLYGGVGLGKTHLMNAIGNYIAQENPDMRVLFISSETFTNELIESIVKKTGTFDLKNRMRNVDVLMVDDVQFLSKTVTTQEEFFNTFNDLHSRGKQIIISSDKPPSEIPTIEERLRSRFEWGLTVDIQKPDYETRLAILKQKAADDGIAAPDAVLDYIAQQVDTNIRALEGSLVRLSAEAELTDGRITLELAQSALSKLFTVREAKQITPELIVSAVAGHFGLSEEDMYSKKRSRDIAGARQVAMYLMREMTQMSTTAVGRVFGGRDHTTVMHGCEKVEESLRSDPQLRRRVDQLRTEIKGG